MISSNTTDRSSGEGLRRRVFRNLTWLAGGNGLGAALSMLAVAANSRALNITDFGALVLLQSSALLLAGIFSFATQQPVIKLGIEALHAGDRERLERILGMGLLADLIGAAAAAVAGVVIVTLLPSLVGLPPNRIGPALIVAGSLLFQGWKTSEGVFRAFDRFDLMGLIQIGVAGLQLLVAVLLWIEHAPFIYYAWLVAGTIASPSVAQLIAAAVLLRGRGFMPTLAGTRQAGEDRREFVAYCWTTSVTGSLDTLRNNGDSTLVGLLISVEAAGIYNVAKQLAGIARKATVIYASVVFPELASMAAARQFEQARHVLRRAARVSLLATGVIVAGAALLGAYALRIVFGPAFGAGQTSLVLLFAAAGLQMLSSTYSMYAQAFIGPTAVLRAYVLATAAFLLVILSGLPQIGISAAAWAQVGFVVVLATGCSAQLRSGRALGEKSA